MIGTTAGQTSRRQSQGPLRSISSRRARGARPKDIGRGLCSRLNVEQTPSREEEQVRGGKDFKGAANVKYKEESKSFFYSFPKGTPYRQKRSWRAVAPQDGNRGGLHSRVRGVRRKLSATRTREASAALCHRVGTFSSLETLSTELFI